MVSPALNSARDSRFPDWSATEILSPRSLGLEKASRVEHHSLLDAAKPGRAMATLQQATGSKVPRRKAQPAGQAAHLSSCDLKEKFCMFEKAD